MRNYTDVPICTAMGLKSPGGLKVGAMPDPDHGNDI
jgi:hypothetical protein